MSNKPQIYNLYTVDQNEIRPKIQTIQIPQCNLQTFDFLLDMTALSNIYKYPELNVLIHQTVYFARMQITPCSVIFY